MRNGGCRGLRRPRNATSQRARRILQPRIHPEPERAAIATTGMQLHAAEAVFPVPARLCKQRIT